MRSETSRRPAADRLIKGISALELLQLLSEEDDYERVFRRFPGLGSKDWEDVLDFRNQVLVPARVAEGKSYEEVGQEFGCTRQNVSAILHKLERDKELQDRWGGLPARTVAFVKRSLRCGSLEELRKMNLTEEELLLRRWIGPLTVDELRKAGAFQPRGE